MQQFTIRDMERLSGVKSHTLRVWEQRYGIIKPMRKESQHRLYTNEDLRELLRVVHLYNKGKRISQIAKLGQEGICQNIEEEIRSGNFYHAIIDKMLEYTANLDTPAFARTLQNAVIELGFEQTVEHVVYPFLDIVGKRWMTNTVQPCQEHFASNLIREMMLAETDKLPHRKTGEQACILLFTPEHEFHEIPLMYLHYLYKSRGIKVLNLGASVAMETVEAVLEKIAVDVLHFHQITNLNDLESHELLVKFCQQFPAKTVAMSGKSTTAIANTLPANAMIVNSRTAMDNLVLSLKAQS